MLTLPYVPLSFEQLSISAPIAVVTSTVHAAFLSTERLKLDLSICAALAVEQSVVAVLLIFRLPLILEGLFDLALVVPAESRSWAQQTI